MINLRDYSPCSLAQICEPVQWIESIFRVSIACENHICHPMIPSRAVMRLSVRGRSSQKTFLAHTPVSSAYSDAERKALPRHCTRKWNSFLINIEIINIDGNWYLSWHEADLREFSDLISPSLSFEGMANIHKSREKTCQGRLNEIEF